jgi:predicted O-methyltransferase YrrM
MTFEEVMEFTRRVGSHVAFEDAECRAYWELAEALAPGSLILEIGLQFGRSTSIIAQVAKEKGHRYVGVDPFTDPPEAACAWLRMMQKIGIQFTLHCMTVDNAFRGLAVDARRVDLALIDGDHRAEWVRKDTLAVMPLIRVGGHLCFHDYGRESLPEVYPTVQGIMAGRREWTEVATVGTLGIWRRIG